MVVLYRQFRPSPPLRSFVEHGFYDQAHFINDFKAFVGRTPGDWNISDDSLAAIFSAVRRPQLSA